MYGRIKAERGKPVSPRTRGLFLALLGLFVFALEALGSGSPSRLVLSEGFEQSGLEEALFVFVTPDPDLGINQIRRLDQAQAFVPFPQSEWNQDFTDKVYWLKLEVDNRRPGEEWVLDQQFWWISELTLYLPQADGSYQAQESGANLKVSQRSFDHYHLGFRFPLPLQGPQTLYLRCKTKHVMELSLGLFSLAQFHEQESRFKMVHAAYFGGLTTILLYNFFLFLGIRERSYLYYILFLANFMVLQLCALGLGFYLLWPNHPGWNDWATEVLIDTGSFLAVLFGAEFLGIKNLNPKAHRAAWAFALLTLLPLLLIPLGPFVFVQRLTYLMLVVTCFVLLGIGFYSRSKGYRPATPYTLAWSIFLAGILVSLLRGFGFLPSNHLTRYSMEYGSLFEMVLLSIALVVRINDLKEQNLTQAQAIGEALTLRNQELNQLDRLKDQFLSQVSHDLRTPLHGIIGIAQDLQGKSQLQDPKFKANLEIITTSAKRLGLLVDDILDFAKINNQGLELHRTWVDLGQLVDLVQVHFRLFLQEKSLAFQKEIAPNFPLIFVDENRLQQILFNLIGNAVKFTDQGVIRLNAKVEGTDVVIGIADTGIGIAPQDQEAIFLPYRQGQETAALNYAGAGLGLSLAKSLVEAHGGKLQVRSQLGAGAEFWFDLPLALAPPVAQPLLAPPPPRPEAPQPAPREPQAAPKAPLPQHSHRPKDVILLVDDDPVNRQVVANYLEPTPFALIEAASGEQALAILQTEVPALILLDVMMPKISGFEVCAQVRKRFSAHKLPIIFLTAKTQMQDLEEGFRLGANDYIYKPFNQEELLIRLHNQLNNRSIAQKFESLRRFGSSVSQLKGVEEVLSAVLVELSANLDFGETAIYHLDEQVLRSPAGKEGSRLTDTLQEQTAELFPGEETVLVQDQLSANPWDRILGQPGGPTLAGWHLALGRLSSAGGTLAVLLRPPLAPAFSRVEVEYLEGLLGQADASLARLSSLIEDGELKKVLTEVEPLLGRVFYVEANSPYCSLFFSASPQSAREVRISLGKLVQVIGEGRLVQIHRSYAVNPVWVQKAHHTARHFELILEDPAGAKAQLPVSRNLTKELKARFPGWFA